MSHVTKMEVNVSPKNIEEFVKALKEEFGQDGVEVNLKTPIEMFRYNGESLHEKNHMGEAPKCHIVVRKAAQEKALGHSALVNDLGYHVTGDKVTAYVDVGGFPQKKQAIVLQNYATYVAIKPLKKQGYTVKVVKENNLVKLKASKYI